MTGISVPAWNRTAPHRLSVLWIRYPYAHPSRNTIARKMGVDDA
jgi:hypothetical protein